MFISFLAVLNWKTRLKKNVDKVPSGTHIFQASAILMALSSALTFRIIQPNDNGRLCKMCKSHWSMKYRSRSPGQGTCQISTSRRSTMQGIVLVGLITEELSNMNIKCVKYRSRSPGQGTCQASKMR